MKSEDVLLAKILFSPPQTNPEQNRATKINPGSERVNFFICVDDRRRAHGGTGRGEEAGRTSNRRKGREGGGKDE